ncbi:Aminoglycoside phosphotransferase [Propionibacterium cyclohexanicum]|uniref:Aminoglycoside phosphotransferase n=1 Tax=Propionibacterium cyclohexanicum TaxID=64702 RepID=A0A1H9QHG1_9ACTN|nr:aminoglycoside phosphotransferase family protein [Propionibacterium cyclohexanicum]SER59870.1 Aminoglycoside phosphotransferase [Propionibacterium cyclohexanicum]
MRRGRFGMPRSAGRLERGAQGGDADGALLLTGIQAREIIAALVSAHGGRLGAITLDQVDAQPGVSTTVTYSCQVRWPDAEVREIVGLSARAGGLSAEDRCGEVFSDGEREVAAWFYPEDPELPGLVRITVAEQACRVLAENGLLGPPLRPERLALHVVGYRPRRNAVVRIEIDGGATVFYVKALATRQLNQAVARLDMLSRARIPVPALLAVTDENLIVLSALPGRAMSHLLFEQKPAIAGEKLVGLLDALPAGLLDMPRHLAWSDATRRYATTVASQLPSESRRLDSLVEAIESGLRGLPPGTEPTHGDFHEGQVHLAGGRVVGLLDVDACGPGRRVDDLACLMAHLSTVQGMDAVQAGRLGVLRTRLIDVFDRRVDPVELRLRTAAVAISLATGPYRTQEPDWQRQTGEILRIAQGWLRAADTC